MACRANRGESKTKGLLFDNVAPRKPSTKNRVTVVGAGQVGIACAVCIIAQGVSNNIVLIDALADRVKGEVLDLRQGALFLEDLNIDGGNDYSLTANSALCIVTAGAAQKPGETRLDLVGKNTEILKSIIPQLVKYSPDTVLMIVTNPCDILTYVAWKISGLPKNKVLGSGTTLDSSRFRYFLSERLNVSIPCCHGFIIGEHGDTSVPVWTGVNVGGVLLRDVNPALGKPDDPENFAQLHKDVVQSAYEVIKLKGYTNWAIGLSCTALAKAILKNSYSVHPVSVFVKGYFGIQHDVCLSLPAVLGVDGVCDVLKLQLSEDEIAALKKSAEAMHEVQKNLPL